MSKANNPPEVISKQSSFIYSIHPLFYLLCTQQSGWGSAGVYLQHTQEKGREYALDRSPSPPGPSQDRTENRVPQKKNPGRHEENIQSQLQTRDLLAMRWQHYTPKPPRLPAVLSETGGHIIILFSLHAVLKWPHSSSKPVQWNPQWASVSLPTHPTELPDKHFIAGCGSVNFIHPRIKLWWMIQ